MNKLMKKLHQIFGSHDEHPTLTTQEERDRVSQALIDQRIRFAAMGIQVEMRSAVDPNAPHRRQGDR